MSIAPEQRPIDLAHLNRYTGGEAGLNAEVLDLFSGQTAEMLRRLESFLDAQDRKAWRDMLHALKGAARGVGAFALGDEAERAERIDPSGERERAAEALRGLTRRFEAVNAFVGACRKN